MRQFIGLFLGLALYSCKPDQQSVAPNEIQKRYNDSSELDREKIKGHWHTVNPVFLNYDYNTLDINDSSKIDAHKLTGVKYFSIPREYNDSLILATFDLSQFTTRFKLNGDTLIVHDLDRTYEYLRSDLKECFQKDLFANLLLDVNLRLSGPGNVSIESLKHTRLVYITVGQLKKNMDLPIDEKYFQQDSSFVEINQILVREPSIITKYVQQELNKSLQTGICLNLDKDTPVSFVKAIIDRVKKAGPENLFRTSFNEERTQVAYERLK